MEPPPKWPKTEWNSCFERVLTRNACFDKECHLSGREAQLLWGVLKKVLKKLNGAKASLGKKC